MTARGAIFRDRNFMSYWLGVALSAIGDSVFSIALSWMIVKITGSGVVMGTYLLAMGIPRMLLILFGGVFVDRMDAKKVMFYSDLLRAAVMSVLLVLSLNGAPPLWAIFVLAVIFGGVDAFYWPAASVVRQKLVSQEHYTQSNSVLTGTMQASVIVGPLIGAALLAAGGYEMNMIVNGLTFVVSALTLLLVQLRPSESATGQEKQVKEKPSFKKDFTAGLRFIWQTPVLLAMMTVIFFANGGANGTGVGLAFLAEEFGVGASGLSQMSAGFGIGGVLGAVVFSLIVIKNPTPRMVIFSFFVQGIALALVSGTTNHWQVAVLVSMVGLSSTAIQVFASSVNQSLISPELMGRVSSVAALLGMGSTPLAQAAAGWVIDSAGPHAVYLMGGGLEVLAAGIGLCLPVLRKYGKKDSVQVENENVSV